ncbi:hypothetical protein [Prevotella lacticifex]|uniref:Uncharacterized protein n=1 Tax=Prevotella lacticifex TaxID=2854755 RepID=A0A9R1CBI5_9BACT|nr:hypothetical protein [Prevotella lacticifex]GJG36840.1 hypothetical protein PRLR5003_19970 [Prevotella lacticifex]GJG38699.1 hypothetical protein PRLR5019_06700 [Prevotella lacticifex]GJG42618.1 hypothetical protein PRLR5025_14040 [Prevotella lacticifex]GJG45056.1 hypothetical protein PRLR5027_06510 [Prevotella lacticifex]GJG48970.1 hypothetical protein PRLR5052_13830 [Prevotella lacticifex]
MYRLCTIFWLAEPCSKHGRIKLRRALTTRNVRGDYTGFTRTVSRARQFGLTATLQLGKMKGQVKQADRTIENNDVVGGAAPSIQQKKLGK